MGNKRRTARTVAVLYRGDGPGCAAVIRVAGREWRRGETQIVPTAEAEIYRGRPGFEMVEDGEGSDSAGGGE